jgi:hypothetical protein
MTTIFIRVGVTYSTNTTDFDAIKKEIEEALRSANFGIENLQINGDAYIPYDAVEINGEATGNDETTLDI